MLSMNRKNKKQRMKELDAISNNMFKEINGISRKKVKRLNDKDTPYFLIFFSKNN